MPKRRPLDQWSPQELGASVMKLVGEVAGQRLSLVIEHIVENNIKPLETENARLRSLLAKHGIKA